MTEPLNYLPKPQDPPARWSWCAVIGFALTWPGPVLGFFLAAAVGNVLPDHDQLPLLIMLLPLLTGLILSIIGAVITSDQRRQLRGRGLALCGVIVGAMWTVLGIILVVGIGLTLYHR